MLALVVKTFLVQAFYIPSGSMEPGLEINDRILVQKVSYWGSGGPERGDIVVFEDPGAWLSQAESSGPTNLLTDAIRMPEGTRLEDLQLSELTELTAEFKMVALD